MKNQISLLRFLPLLIAFLLSLLAGLGLAGCDAEGDNIGLGDDFPSIFSIDTARVLTSTVMLDSVPTSGTGVVLVGQVTDVKLGKIKAKSYFSIGLNSTFVPEDNAEYDSLVLFLNYTYHYGDTTQLQTIRVHQLSSTIELDDDRTAFYNTDTWVYQPELLGSVSFRPKPNRGKALQIRLSDVLGNDLFQSAKNELEIMTEEADFQAYFKGLALTPAEDDNAAVLGFSTGYNTENQNEGLFIRLYYHEGDEEKHHDFTMANTPLQFNHIQSDKSNTAIVNLQSQPEDISSDLTNCEAYIQGGIGLYTKIKMPTIDKFSELGINHKILKAELVIKPLRGTYSDKSPLPQTLVLYGVNKKNRIDGVLVNSAGNQIGANPVIDSEFQENTYYKFDITEYIWGELQDEEFTENDLLIGLPSSDIPKTINRAILGGWQHQNQAIELRVVITRFNL
jgi:hypothetical protein